MFSFAPNILTGNIPAVVSPAPAIIAAIFSAGGTLSSGQQTALTTYVDTLVTAGIWSKRILLYGIMGGTDASHAINWATLGVNTLSYAGTSPTSTSSGIQFNGGYALTGYNPSSGNFALTTYSRDSDIRLGTVDAGLSASRFYGGFNSSLIFNAVNSINQINTAAVGVKHAVTQRTDASTLKTFADGVLLGTFSEGNATATSEILIAILRNGGLPAFPQSTTSVCQHYGIWQALSDAEALSLYNAEITLQIALGRN
jgi:hypothetical protein